MSASRFFHALGAVAGLFMLAGCAPKTMPTQGAAVNLAPTDEARALLLLQAKAGDKFKQLELGEKLDAENQPDEAAKWYQLAAQQGLAEAQFRFADMLASGEGTPKQPDEAAKWFRRAALQDHPKAQFNLAMLHANGEGVPQSESDASQWLRKSAAAGFDEAQYVLAGRLLRGTSIKELAEAALWLEHAAKQNHREAQYYLGDLLARGRGVKVDRVQAYKWFSLAAAAGHTEAGRTKPLLARLMSQEEIAEAQKLSQDFKPGP